MRYQFGFNSSIWLGEKHDRVVDYVPDARFERTSVLATVRLSGVNAPLTFRGALNGDVFVLYVRYVLVPTLNAGDVVLLDSLSSHKVDGVLDPVFERVRLFGFCLFIRRI